MTKPVTPYTGPRYVCDAPPGACGFRGRNWRAGQAIAGYTLDGKPRCMCGSEMRELFASVALRRR